MTDEGKTSIHDEDLDDVIELLEQVQEQKGDYLGALDTAVDLLERVRANG